MTRKPFPTSLGDVAAGWIEANCCRGPGDVYGQPVRLTAEEHRFLEDVYRLDPATGRRAVDIAMYSHRKGSAKSELGAFLAHFEALGPARARLDDGGHAVAASVFDPHVLCVATTEDQAELVYGAFRAIAKASDRLARRYDVGLEVTHLVGRPGKVTLEQSRNEDALDGARPTFEVIDEGHRWTHLLRPSYRVLRLNLRKRRIAQPWLMVPTTAYAPGEGSVAEVLHEHGTKRRVVVQHRQASEHWDLNDPPQRREAIREAIGDAHWCDADATEAEWHDPDANEVHFRRFMLNQPRADSGRPFTPAGWDAQPRGALAAGDEIVLGFDGGRYRDATALVACRLDDGLLAPIAVWERPTGAAGVGWEVAPSAVEYVLRRTFDRYRVRRLEADPPRWHAELEAWVLRWGDDRVRAFHTIRPSQMGPAIDRFGVAYRSGRLTHDGNPTLRSHVVDIAEDEDRGYLRWRKFRPGVMIDAGVAAAIAYDVRGRILAEDTTDDEPPPQLQRVRRAAYAQREPTPF
jgi:hypothetical protein